MAKRLRKESKMRKTLLVISWISTVLFTLALIGNAGNPPLEILITIVFALQPILTLIYLYKK